MLPAKGLTDNPWLVREISDEFRAWGRVGQGAPRLALRSDGEVALRAVRDAVADFVQAQVVTETSPPGESAANGAAEAAGRQVREQARVFRYQIEDACGGSLFMTDHIVLWLVRWAAMAFSRCMNTCGGKSGYHHVHGRPACTPFLAFGESVWFRAVELGDRRSKFDTSWFPGVWLGHVRGSSETWVRTPKGCFKTWSVRRRPAAEQWSLEAIRGVHDRPESPSGGGCRGRRHPRAADCRSGSATHRCCSRHAGTRRRRSASEDLLEAMGFRLVRTFPWM